MKKLGKIERLILETLEESGRGEIHWLNEDTLYFSVIRSQYSWQVIPHSATSVFNTSLKRLERKGLIRFSGEGEERRVILNSF